MDYLVRYYESKYAKSWGSSDNQDDKHIYEPYVETGIGMLAKAGTIIPFKYISYFGIINYISQFFSKIN